MRSDLIGASILIGLLSCPLGAARAQDVGFLVAEPAGAAPGAAVALHVERAGDGPPAREAWPDGRAEWLFIRTAGEQENRHRVKADEAGGDTVGIAMPADGVAMVGLDLAPVITPIDAGAFEAFRREHTGGGGAAAAANTAPARPQAPVRVRRFESMASIVRVVEPGREPSSSAIATAKAGLTVEVRTLMDPGALRAGSDLPVRVYVRGAGQGGAKVIATHVASGQTQVVTADSSGICGVRIGETGSWRVEFHHAVASVASKGGEEAGEADWNLFSATLTFEVVRPAEEAPAKEAE